jgi:hypothetical protein|uniref:Uncharacterized protein n=1 Tax=Ackermannviridae sp. TaxID=2831612 RepID=A0A8S5VTK5_9CAUD|nr:MAG TPA: hypothetical protein [Ackermannviridae sp.]
MNDNRKTMKDYQRIIERKWLKMVELKRGTFLVLEDIQWGRNSVK